MTQKNDELIFKIIQWATIFVFLGRGWQHIYWDAPYREILWDESLMKPIIETFFGIDWTTYITDLNVNDGIQRSIKIIGFFYITCAAIAFFIKKLPPFFHKILLVASAGLIFLAFLYCKERFFNIGQFFEYTLQWISPLLLYILLQKGKFNTRTIFWMKVAIALTFSCHGLYAINYYPRPGHFVEMSMNILGTNEEATNQFLYLMGWMDFVVSILLFLPFKYARWALFYAIFWGFMTSIARLWAHFYWDYIGQILMQWTHQSILRFPHFLIPLAVYVQLRINRKL